MLANKYTQRTSPILCLSHSLLTIFTHIFKMSTTSSRNIILRQKKKIHMEVDILKKIFEK